MVNVFTPVPPQRAATQDPPDSLGEPRADASVVQLPEPLRLLLGAASMSASVVRRATPGPHATEDGLATAVDCAVGIGVEALSLGVRGGRLLGRTLRPVAGMVLRPPLVGERSLPERVLRAAAWRGQAERTAAETHVASLVPAALETTLDQLDLTELVTEIVLRRVDLSAVVDAALDQLDLTDVVLRQVDLHAVVDAVLDELDLTALVLQRVDLPTLVAAVPVEEVVSRVDVDAIAGRLDVDAVAARLDLDAVVGRLDLVGLARYVIDTIDLAEIIRTSTGTMASETVREIRLRSIDADERTSRIVDRLLLRQRPRDEP